MSSLLQLIDNAIDFVSNARDGSNAIAPISSPNSSFYNIDEDELTCLYLDQIAQFKKDGFCVLNGPDARAQRPRHSLLKSQVALIVRGYVKRNYDSEAQFEDGVILLLIEFYGWCFNEKLLVQFALTMPNHPESPSPTILIPRRCALLSSEMCAKMDSVPMSAAAIDLNDDLEEDKKLPWEPMQKVFRYLAHHNGKEPDPLPCPVRSIHMSQIVSDKWDATFIDDFEKKEIFEIILCANALKVQSLLHLGCAKIATLIKQLDQQEINRIIEEEERYRREHAADDAVEAEEKEEVKNDGEEEEEEVMDIGQRALNEENENEEDADEDENENVDIDLAEPADMEQQLSDLNYSDLEIQETSSLVRQFSGRLQL